MIVSFIVPAYNEEHVLTQCLKAIQALRLPESVREVEIIVADNQSTDKTSHIATMHGAQVVSITPGRASRARNAGAAVARGEWLAFVDADCEVAPDWLEMCAHHFLRDNVVAVGGSLSLSDGPASWVERASYDLIHRDGSKSTRQVAWLTTQALLVRKSTFATLGGFNESMETCEDCELGFRLGNAGTLLKDDRALFVHHGESKTLLEIFRREAWRSGDNLKLALSRPLDFRNWLSLLIPPFFVLGWMISTIGLIVSVVSGLPIWPAAVSFGLFSFFPFALVLLKRRTLLSLANWTQQSAILTSYCFGRSFGLIRSFPRVAERRE